MLFSPARTSRRPQYVAAELAPHLHAGMRAHMLRVYNYMGGGVACSGGVAWFAAQSGVYSALVQNSPGVMILVMLAPIGVALFLGFGINKISLLAAQISFWIFAALMGFSLAGVLLVYTGESVIQAFLAAAVAFLSLSLYGYLTKRDLSPFASFLMMGLIGVIVASLINLFIQSSALSFGISAIGVLVFAGLTAYDTQRIKNQYFISAQQGEVVLQKTAVIGALTLYLDFINLFLLLLRFIGERR